MKKFLALLLLILFAIFAWFGWGWYKQNIACCNQTKEVKKVVQEAVKYGPLVYNWDSGKAITNDLWPAKKKEIIAGLADGKILRIIGPYFKDEVNNTTFENMGFARADAAKQLMLDAVPAEQIETGSKLIDFLEDAKTIPFGDTSFQWVVRNENIQEIDNKALIYFPYNSTKKLENANINDYLAGVAKSLKGNEKKVALSGHTDNKGRPSYNKSLALKRANRIKAILVKLGISADRISTTSFGEEKPIDTNDTDAGRQKNRRVELEIQ